jgi:XapX domain-containing protein
MRLYLLSLGAGLLVGIIYSLINVRSPAPPVVALVGLLGMLIGEQVIPVGKEMLLGTTWTAALNKAKCAAHVFGRLPGRNDEPKSTAIGSSSPEQHS